MAMLESREPTPEAIRLRAPFIDRLRLSPRVADNLCILSIATEWRSVHGGVSTLNRQLCCALAAIGARVFCVVLSASEEDHRQANLHGVTLVTPAATPGAPMLALLARRPLLPVIPDIIVGHGRFTGPAAQSLAEDHFPRATLVQVIHLAPDEIEWLKLNRPGDAGARAEDLTHIELALARNAHRVVAIGPRLHARYLNELSPFATVPPLRVDPGFDLCDTTQRLVPPGEPIKVLFVGRAELADAPLKGLDLAAKAVGRVMARRGQLATEIELVVRGAPANTCEELRSRLHDWSKQPGLSIVVREFAPDAELLSADLRRASVVIMPSRAEGFGLVGVEAVVAGTPVLASSVSGFGMLLREFLSDDEAARFVVPVRGDDRQDVDQWARAIEAVLRDRDAAFVRAHQLRLALAQTKTWARAAADLVAGMRQAVHQ